MKNLAQAMNIERIVPDRLLAWRPMSADDAACLAGWIAAGRSEGAFRGGPALDGAGVLAYQRRMGREGRIYQCWILEDRGRRVGYIDTLREGRIGSILGLYLCADVRGGHHGRHVLRRVASQLVQEGCGEVRSEVYAENRISLAAFKAAGFERVPARDRIEDRRAVRALGRRVRPLRPLAAVDQRYGLLRGENLYHDHVAAAEAVTAEVNRIAGVRLVLGLGSLFRGFGDAFSDIDLAVVGRGESLLRIEPGEHFVLGTSVDVFVVDTDASPVETWDVSRRQAFGESVVLWCGDARLLSAVRRSTRLGGGELRRRIAEALLKLGWIGFAPRRWANHHRYGYFWSVPPDVWRQRGSVETAHDMIDVGWDLAMELLYLANGRHVPDAKWKSFLLPGLEFRPRGLAALTRSITAPARTSGTLVRRTAALLTAVERIVVRLEARGFLKGDIYRDYLRHTADYHPRAQRR